MIEVEKKFKLTKGQEQKLVANADLVSQKEVKDDYFDTSDYALTRRDWWLRRRNGTWELKLPRHQGTDRLADQYEEIENEDQIKQKLQFSEPGSLQDLLKQHGYTIFCACTTNRRKYRHGEFIIDIDDVTADEFQYALAEVEKMVKDESQIDEAIASIMQFTRQYHLIPTLVRGKVIEYLRQKRPGHYQALVKAGVVKDF